MLILKLILFAWLACLPLSFLCLGLNALIDDDIFIEVGRVAISIFVVGMTGLIFCILWTVMF